MKNNKIIIVILAALLLSAASCKKENSVNTESTSVNTSAADVIAVAATADASANGKDSIYLVNACERGQHRDSVAFSSLPSAISTYLSANYSGYTNQKAFSVKDTSGNVKAYITVIQYNGKPVGLQFDASGNFVRVLEQREGRDMNGPGWHRGGHFDDRDGLKRDTLALASLPASVKSYFVTNYAQDTLTRAYVNHDSSIVVVSINNGVFATVFTSGGTFIKRTQLPAKPGRPVAIDISALPANAQAYLTATYPNYVFKQAFKVSSNNVLQGYVVFIDANATKYAVAFDASGAFLKAVAVR